MMLLGIVCSVRGTTLSTFTLVQLSGGDGPGKWGKPLGKPHCPEPLEASLQCQVVVVSELTDCTWLALLG